jgi:hypothetical protein
VDGHSSWIGGGEPVPLVEGLQPCPVGAELAGGGCTPGPGRGVGLAQSLPALGGVSVAAVPDGDRQEAQSSRRSSASRPSSASGGIDRLSSPPGPTPSRLRRRRCPRGCGTKQRSCGRLLTAGLGGVQAGGTPALAGAAGQVAGHLPDAARHSYARSVVAQDAVGVAVAVAGIRSAGTCQTISTSPSAPAG